MFTRSDTPIKRVISRTLSGVVALRVTVAYAVVLVLIDLTIAVLGPQFRHAAVNQMSTNLENLGRGHLETLIGSAFVTDCDMHLWLPAVVFVLALGELAWCSRRLVFAFVVGHIGATLIVAAWLTVAVTVHWLPIEIAHHSDVGISYGVAGVLGAITAAVPSRWRAAWIGWWLGIALFHASSGHFTPIGHAVALMLGIAIARRLGEPARWTRTRVLLVAVNVAIGYAMFAGSSPTTALAGLAGVLVAVLVVPVAAKAWTGLRAQLAVVTSPQRLR